MDFSGIFTKHRESILNSFRIVFFTALIYAVIVARWGYEAGRNDQMQLAYSVYINQPDLFKNDFFIQSIHEKIPNERTVFNSAISFFGNHYDTVSLIGHIIFSLILLLGIYKISGLFIRNELLKYLVLLVLFIPLYNINIGGCELYYNSFISSNVAKAFGVWAFYMYLKQNSLIASCLFSVSALFHPLAGFLPFIVLCGVEIIQYYQKKSNIKKLLIFLVPFALIALPIIFLEAKNYNDGDYNETEIFNIFFKFRNAHHFIPSYFSLISALILLPLWILSYFFYRKENKLVYHFLMFVILGCAVYIIGVQWFHSTLFASTQWFKNTIWIEMFAVIAIVAFIEKKTEKLWLYLNMRIAFFALVFFCFFSIGSLLFLFGKRNIYLDFIPGKQHDAAFEISIQTRQKTDKEALFITPLNFTELKYYGLRSTYVDFKSPVHRKSKFIEWMNRIKMIYGIDYLSTNTGFNIVAEADSNYVNLSTEKILSFKEFGITNILTYKRHQLNLPVVGANSVYCIYSIP